MNERTNGQVELDRQTCRCIYGSEGHTPGIPLKLYAINQVSQSKKKSDRPVMTCLQLHSKPSLQCVLRVSQQVEGQIGVYWKTERLGERMPRWIVALNHASKVT